MKVQPPCWAVLIVLVGSLLALGDEPAQPTDKQRAEQLARMKDLAASIRLLANPQLADSAIQLVAQPVLRYSDNTRQTFESSMWIWSNGGRPSAIAAFEYHSKKPPGPRWLFEIASPSTQPIAAERGTELHWTAKGPGLVFAPLSDAEPPADKAARRLTQMKELRERFTAHEQATIEGRIELRPLGTPLYRYESSDQDIIDGAIFAFCNGTNPEVLLLLEAQKVRDGPSAWHYALVQTSGEAVTAQLDTKQIWERGHAHLPAIRDSYVNGWLSAEWKGEEGKE
jgi:hypothetical protein